MIEQRTAHIEVIALPEGLFRAQCGELGLVAEASNPAEAEAIVRRLMEERIEMTGSTGSPAVVAADPDLVPGSDLDER